MCEELEIQLNEIPDWNCCGAFVSFHAIKSKAKKPLEGLKIAGYVGCQTNRPFGIAGESFENPRYLDNIIESVGAEIVVQMRICD